MILGMLWLACHNPEIDQRTGEVKMIRYIEEYGKQQRLKQKKLGWEKQKEEEKKEEAEKEQKKERNMKKSKKKRTIKVKKVVKE